MSIALVVAGVIMIIMGIIQGVVSGSAGGFVLGLYVGIASALIFFGLAAMLNKQDDILTYLKSQDERLKKQPVTIECTRCEKEYDDSYSGCPYCAFKPGQ